VDLDVVPKPREHSQQLVERARREASLKTPLAALLASSSAAQPLRRQSVVDARQAEMPMAKSAFAGSTSGSGMPSSPPVNTLPELGLKARCTIGEIE
jgi:hypothetical protein